MRIKENELNNVLNIFNNKDVIINIVDDFKEKIELDKLHINFNYEIGFIFINDYIKKNNIKINITSVRYIELKKSILKIQLDNSSIIIKIKN